MVNRDGLPRATLHQIVAFLVAIFFLLPIFWAFIASLREPGLPPAQSVEWMIDRAYWSNYLEVFRQVPFARYLRNSAIVTTLGVLVTLFTASPAGLGLILLGDRARRWLVLGSIALLIVPATAVWVFRFQVLSWFGLVDSLGALIVPAIGASSPLFVLLYYWAFRHIPMELLDAARLDGASLWQLWRHVAMPLVRPTTAVVALLAFVFYWNDFVSPLLYVFEPQFYTAPIGLQVLKQIDPTNYPIWIAGAMLMTLPVIVTFMFLPRYFLSDLSPATLFNRN